MHSVRHFFILQMAIDQLARLVLSEVCPLSQRQRAPLWR
jgi:hypothetical protein